MERSRRATPPPSSSGRRTNKTLWATPYRCARLTSQKPILRGSPRGERPIETMSEHRSLTASNGG
eukprot:5861495-Pyramimonas_sp.AAC.1